MFPAPSSLSYKHVGCPAEVDRLAFYGLLDDALNAHRLTNNGPLVQEFERRVADYSGTRHAIAVCNGTAGLQLAAHVLGLRNKPVACPSFTFIATPHALAWIGAQPVFCDVKGITIDPDEVEKALQDGAQGILATHVFGQLCDVVVLEDLSDKYNVPLIFDAAHSFDSSGPFGDCEVLSFHATKVVSCWEGGAIVTNDYALADALRKARDFGFDGIDNVTGLGINAKMSEMSAAAGLVSLDGYKAQHDDNYLDYLHYRTALECIPGIVVIQNGLSSNYQYVAILVEHGRDALMQKLHDNGILARRYFWPGCHRCPPYNTNPVSLPRTEQLCEQVLCLPTGAGVTDSDITAICEVIRAAA